MSDRTQLGDEASAAYRAALSRIERARQEAAARATKAMSSTSGWQAAAKAAGAQAVLEATMGECRAIIAELVEEQVRTSGNREGIARRICEGFIDKLEPPGTELFKGLEAAAVAPAIAHHRAEFELCVHELKREVFDLAVATEGTPLAPAARLSSFRRWLDVVGSIWVGSVVVWGGARLVGMEGVAANAGALLFGLVLSYVRWILYERREAPR